VYDEVSSTCQLVYRILKHANVQIDQQIALALCAGIFTDTIHFHKGDAESFQAFGELFELSGLSFDEIKDLYIVDERNDRKAIIRAALQAQHIQIHEYEILVTEIDTNIPTFAARALLDLGADVSVVGYANGSEMEVRMYVRNEIQQRFALHAADILKRVKHIQKEHVWGYSLFAGYRSKGDVKDILQSVIETLKDIFN
jgi:bifunctional oligoribonuclease and PAP phosphatase NrnA